MSHQPVTALDKLRCVEREIGMRRRVYPGWVAAGRMTQEKAAREIAVMEAIAADYRAGAEAEQQAGRLL